MTKKRTPPRGPVFSPGTIVMDRFRITDLMGSGGMGEVYRAEDLTLNETVALKVLTPYSDKPNRVPEVLQEVRLARQVSHNNVCRVHDMTQVGGVYVISMEFINGEDLASLLKRVGRLPYSSALDIGVQIAHGLAALHAQNILHLDLKPANVMVDRSGDAKITDFGQAGRTGSKAHGGTPTYMAPELYDGDIADVSSDLYALGLVLFELVTGKKPFKGPWLVVAYHHHDVVPTPPSALVDGIDPRVERIILKCLEKEPARRPASAGAVCEVLLAARTLELETVPELFVGPRGITRSAAAASEITVDSSIHPRKWAPRKLPDRPYPVLLPYTHPKLLAGRKHELAKLKRLLRLPQAILGLHAASGVGKSSVLMGGLLPWLRSAGWPVSYNRYPWEPGLPGLVLADLIEDGISCEHEKWHEVAQWLSKLCRVADETPLIIIDQFEELFLRENARRARALVGALLAATCQRQPGSATSSCQWVLCFRQEYHGEVMTWLADVLADGRAEEFDNIDSLPHDFAGPERFQSMSLSPLGTSLPGVDPIEGASNLFQEAIEAPLRVRDENGELLYKWRFADGDSGRLARAFARARIDRPVAPLVPELQVVLAYLLASAEQPKERGEAFVIHVPDDPDQMIGEALEDHLKRSLKSVFPPGQPRSEQECSRALLALRELAHADGRRQEGLSEADLVRAIGPSGKKLLNQLATPDTRLVVAWREQEGFRDSAGHDGNNRSGDVRWALSHDRMAEAIVHLVEQEGQRGGLTVDAELLALRRFVTLESALLQVRGNQPGGLSRRRFLQIEAYQDALLWDEPRKQWWSACRKRRRTDQRRIITLASMMFLAILLVAAGAWRWAAMRTAKIALIDSVATGEPAAAMQAFNKLVVLPEVDPELLREQIKNRENPVDFLERGIDGLPHPRGEAVLRAVEFALPLVREHPDDIALIATLVWALDFSPGQDEELAARTQVLRDEVVAPLRAARPLPGAPDVDDAQWASIPEGRFVMAREQGAGVRQVQISGFRMLTHEVTNKEFRCFEPHHRGQDDQPAANVNWYQAYAYAAWLGGRLPTEAEWEYAARAGCVDFICGRDGSSIKIDDIAWTLQNSRDPQTLEPRLQPVALLEPNYWGLYDMLGNAWEWTSDWMAPLPTNPVRDPWGPAYGSTKVICGGCFRFQAHRANPYLRIAESPASGDVGDQGFRVVLPALSR